MNRHIDVDRTLEDWLAEGPNELPDIAIDAIVRQLNETKQRRPMWLSGRERMNRLMFSIGAAAATIIVAVVSVAYLTGAGGAPVPGGISPTPAPTATPTPSSPSPGATTASESVLFVSERHAYSMLLPDDEWTVIERVGEWREGAMFAQESSGVDYYIGPVGDYRHEVFLNSQPIPERTPFEEWRADYEELAARTFPHCRSEPPSLFTDVDGETAQVRTAVCAGQRWAEAVWSHGDRAYVLRVAERADSKIAIESPQAEIQVWLSRISLLD